MALTNTSSNVRSDDSLFIVVNDASRYTYTRLSGYHYNKIKMILRKFEGERIQYSVYLIKGLEGARKLASILPGRVRVFRVVEEL